MRNRLGMYVHMHWGYNHPYAARTWTMDDWHGYAEGLCRLGYNTIMIWPVFETIPDPLTESDKVHLQKIHDVIDMLHHDFGMQAFITMGPNTIGNERAAEYTFETRPFFATDTRLNPGDPEQLDLLLNRRRTLFSYLSNADGFSIIDSDPGGYVGSTNAEFANLLLRHFDVIKEYNPNAILLYWMHVGWETYNRMWQDVQQGLPSPDLEFTAKDFEEVIGILMQYPTENWMVTSGMQVHQDAIAKYGIQNRTMFFSYGIVEGEPTFPLTNYYPEYVAEALKRYSPADMGQGAMANAQTHAVQLPHTYLFAHFIKGGTLENACLDGFADGLVSGLGDLIAESWKSMYRYDTTKMRANADQIESQIDVSLNEGLYSGLLFGSPQRFLEDLAMQLRYRAASVDFINAIDSNMPWKTPLKDLLSAWRIWQQRTGFVDAYGDVQGLHPRLKKLGDPTINKVLADFDDWRNPEVRHGILPRLLDAIENKVNE